MSEYQFDTFFNDAHEARDAHRKIFDMRRDFVVLLGPGGNGKSQLVKQLTGCPPSTMFNVVNEGESELDFGHNQARHKRKTIYVCNTVSALDAIPNHCTYDIVPMIKTF
jgi:ABC-type phosphate/phosphonate transport system ATPase subunit